MSSTRRSFSLRQPVVVDIGCNCRRPRLFSIFSSSLHSKPKSPNSSTSTATTFTTTTTTTTTTTDSSCPPSFTTNSLYEEGEDNIMAHRRRERRRRRKQAKRDRGGRVARESVPVAVESSEPYEDFRESMVQMVVEKEIYAWDDLNDLLHQFLSLNSPRHHPLILHAFSDLWNRNGLFSPPSPCL